MKDEDGQVSGKALKEFLAEAEDILERFNSDLLLLGGLAAGEPIPPERLNNIFRCAHSLKGISGLFGFARISSVAHSLENLLDSLRLGKLQIAPEILDLLFEGMESIGGLLRSEDGKGMDLQALDGLKIRIGDAKAKEKAEDAKSFLAAYDLGENILSVLTEYEEHRLAENLRRGNHLYIVHSVYDIMTFDRDLVKYLEELKEQGEVITPLPDSSSASPNTLAFDILFATLKDSKDLAPLFEREPVRVTEVKKKARSPAEPQLVGTASSSSLGVTPAPAAPAPDIPVAVSPVPAPSTGGSPAERTGQAASGFAGKGPADKRGEYGETERPSIRSLTRTVKVDVDRLDAMMNAVGEMILSKSEIGIIAERWKLGEEGPGAPHALWRAAKKLERRLATLQTIVLDVRMVPLERLFEKLARIVRKVSRQVGKEIDLVERGGETRLDKLITEELADPLMHIIRNSLDHGIEPADERVRAGKPAMGTIELRASQKGNFVLIEVVDDGKGIDAAEVRRVALEKGLIQEGEILGRRETLDLVFAPGFTTKKDVSELSGRGVGMDVVKKNITELKGAVHIDTAPGAGTRVTILLPMTLAMIQVLIVREMGHAYAIPLNSIEENFQIRREDIQTVEGREVITLRGKTVALLRLGSIFGWAEAPRSSEILWVVIVGLGEEAVGIVVDELAGQQDIVIKDVGPLLRGVRGVAGAADLGGGETILVLDPIGLVEAVVSGPYATPAQVAV